MAGFHWDNRWQWHEADNPAFTLISDSGDIEAVSEYELTLPVDAESVLLVCDLTASVDGVNITHQIEIGGAFQTPDVDHSNVSHSGGATYVGITSSGRMASPGNATGESLQNTLLLTGIKSTTLYPTTLQGGGYVDTSGRTRMSQGAHARKAAGAITAVKILPASGTISGRIRAYKNTGVAA